MSDWKAFLKKIPGVYHLGRFAKQRYLDVIAASHLLRERRIQRQDGPIRVGFLCQYIPGWTKVAPIYAQMVADSRFAPYLICIPSEQVMAKESFPMQPENDTYDYFVSKGYPAINALTGADQWLDLQSLELSYIFYPRPYNDLLPPAYRVQKVSCYSRICLVLYGMGFSKEDMTVALNRSFMSHVYAYFAETSYAQTLNRKNNWLLHALGLQKSLCLGYPVFDALLDKKEEKSVSWEFSKNAFRVLWTPRWTTDKALGGTNFFNFYQKLMDYARQHPDVDILHRPHPLALTRFLESGEMTQQQVDDYKMQCATMPNVSLDTKGEYEATFWGSSVLVSDISGMMPEFFVTGKPLIFCADNMELELAPHILTMLEGCYVIRTAEELFEVLQMLRSGKDPKQAKRQELICQLFGDLSTPASIKICEMLSTDTKK